MTGIIYFISYGNTGWIKIGYATNLKSRLHALRVSSPEELTVAATIPGTRKDEKALHYALECFRGRGEWFRPEPLIKLITEMAFGGRAIDELIAFAKASNPKAKPEHTKQLQILQWSRWANEEALPAYWRERYRNWLLEDHGIKVPKLCAIIEEADATRSLRSVA